MERPIYNDAWIDFWSNVSCCTLTRSKSDHFPLLLDFKKEVTRHTSAFKFHKMWASHPGCYDVILEVWKQNFIGCPMFILSPKLKALKLKLKDWNVNVFGNVHARVNAAIQNLNLIQEQIDRNGFSDSLFDQEKMAQVDLQQAIHYQESFLQEKARLNWHTSGDRNTEYFHKLAKVRNVSKEISILKRGDDLLTNPAKIESHIVSYYEDLFASNNECRDNGLIEEVISLMVTDIDNEMLTCLPSLDEVKKAVFGLNGDGAPGHDGFGGFFFQKYWAIVADDVYKVVLQFFNQS